MSFRAIIDLLDQLRNQQKAELLVISDQQQALSLAQTPICLPAHIPEWLTPLVSILPAQLFAYHLTRERGYDTESPRSIHKVTETRERVYEPEDFGRSTAQNPPVCFFD